MTAESRGDVDLSRVGSLLADPGRCRVLLALGDGRSLPASQLADEAGVSPSTASEHLAKLVAGELLTVARRGRYRYYCLAGPKVGELIEAVARLSPPQPIRSLRQETRAHAVRRARSCYGHLAGQLGVNLTDAMVEQQLLVGDNEVDLDRMIGGRPAGGVLDPVGLTLTPTGRDRLTTFGVDLPVADVVRCCVDWTEQRHHVSGAFGRAVLRRLHDLDWLRRSPSGRAVLVTDAGRQGLLADFGVTVTD
jgi:DNA-binding transcriptional ArsR family regulator